MTEDEDAKTLKLLEDMIRRVVREELEQVRALVREKLDNDFRELAKRPDAPPPPLKHWQGLPMKSIAGGLVD